MGTTKALKAPIADDEKAILAAKTPPDRFKKGGFAIMPNAVYMVLPSKAVGAQFMAIMTICMESFGHVSEEWVKISCATLARRSPYDAKTFDIALREAAKAGLVERRRPTCRGKCAVNACECAGREWVYRVFPENWESVVGHKERSEAAAKEAAAKEAAAKEAAAKEAEDADDDAELEQQTTRRYDPLVILPGRRSRPIPLSMELKGSKEPVPFRVQCVNESSGEFSIVPSVVGDLVCLTFRQSPERRTNGEVIGSAFPMKPAKNEHPFGSVFPKSPHTFQKNQSLSDFQSYLSVVCLKRFSKAADAVLVQDVYTAARGATLAEYSTLVEARLRRGADIKSPRLLIKIAEEAALAHEARAALGAVTAKTSPADDHAAMVASLRRSFGGDPKTIADMRAEDPALAEECFGPARESASGD